MQVLGKPTAASLAVKHVQRNMKNWSAGRLGCIVVGITALHNYCSMVLFWKR